MTIVTCRACAISALDSPRAIRVKTSRSPVGDAFQGRGGLPAGFRAAGELGDEPPGDGRGELSVAGGDDPDRGEQAGGRGVLQQEPAGPARSAA